MDFFFLPLLHLSSGHAPSQSRCLHANMRCSVRVTQWELLKGAVGEASTEPRAVLAVECGEGKNVAPRLRFWLFCVLEREADRKKGREREWGNMGHTLGHYCIWRVKKKNHYWSEKISFLSIPWDFSRMVHRVCFKRLPKVWYYDIVLLFFFILIEL